MSLLARYSDAKTLYHSCLDAKDYANRAFIAAAAFIILLWILLAVGSMFKWMTRSGHVSSSDVEGHKPRSG
jgi:hypothetical protein